MMTRDTAAALAGARTLSYLDDPALRAAVAPRFIAHLTRPGLEGALRANASMPCQIPRYAGVDGPWHVRARPGPDPLFPCGGAS